MPRVYLRNIHGTFYDENYNKVNCLSIKDIFGKKKASFIVKPSLDTQKGKNVNKIWIKNGELYYKNNKYQTIDVLIGEYGIDFLIQEDVKQHPIHTSI